MDDRLIPQITDLGKASKKKILQKSGYKSVNQYIVSNNLVTARARTYPAAVVKRAWDAMTKNYNEAVVQTNNDIIQARIVTKQAISEYNNAKRASVGTYIKSDYKMLPDWGKIKKTDAEVYNTQNNVFIRMVRVDYMSRKKADDWTAEDQKWLPAIKAHRMETVIGKSLADLNKKAKYLQEQLMHGLGKVSPELNSDFKPSLGKVYNSNNRVVLNKIKMKAADHLKLNGVEHPKWDVGNGACVFDALISLWAVPNSKMEKKANYRWLTDFFKSGENEDPYTNGVSIDDLYRLAVAEQFCMYAFNINDVLITKHVNYETEKSRKPVLIFRLFNNHMYLIEDKHKRLSLVAKVKDGETVRHNKMENHKRKEQEPKTYTNVIAPNLEINGNDFATQFIFENNAIPFPFTTNNVNFEKGHIKKMIIGDEQIFTYPVEKDIEEYLKKVNEPYNGQHYVNLLMQKWEEIYEKPLKENELVSELNPIAYDYFKADNVKNRVHLGFMLGKLDMEALCERIDNGSVVGADIIKCYSSILDNPAENWLQYKITDEVVDYNGTLQAGLYYVETNDLTVLHKSNWYSNTILEYATSVGIDFTIYKQFIPSKVNDNKDYFKKFIDNVSKDCGIKLTKNVLNSLTGMMGKTNTSSYKTSITTDINEVWDLIALNLDKIDTFFLKHQEYQDKTLYIYGFKKKSAIYTNNLPMYIQILDQSNILLHKLQVKMGGELIYRKTDAVVMLKGKNIVECDKNLRKNWGKETILPKDEMKLFNYEFKAETYRSVDNPFNNEVKGWKKNFNLVNSNQSKEIIDYAVEHGGLLCCSRPGTGKSYLVNKAVEKGLIPADKRCRLAFTNRARKNINGSTIHSAVSINKETDKASIKMIEMYKGKNVVVVDEVSMISAELWAYLVLLKRVAGVIFILLGDYRQLPAVESVEHDYFDSSIMKYLANNNRIELLVRQRCDVQLWDWLEDFYEKGKVGKFLQTSEVVDYTAVNICYFNNTRRRINKMYMDELKPIDALFLPHTPKDADDRAADIWIYKDLPVMAIVNKTKLNKKSDLKQALYCNSDPLKVIAYDDKIITLQMESPDEDGNDIIEVEIKDFHKSFVCNYCSTTHKNQGATITRNIQLWDWDRMVLDRRIGYTAVSRAKKLTQVKKMALFL